MLCLTYPVHITLPYDCACERIWDAHLKVAAFLFDQELLIELLDEVDFALLPQLVREVLQHAEAIRSALIRDDPMQAGAATTLTMSAAAPLWSVTTAVAKRDATEVTTSMQVSHQA